MLHCAVWLFATLAATLGSLPLDTRRLHASVGGYAVFDCHLDFPFGNEIPYQLHWDKDDETILWWHSGDGEGRERVAAAWSGRVRRLPWPGEVPGLGPGLGLGRGSINVSAVRESDAGLYRCRVTFPNRSPPARNNGTFYYLHVDGGNLIVTPPMNVTVLEGSRAELECQPRGEGAGVSWWREGGEGGELRAAHNGSLVLSRTAAADAGRYECRVSDPTGAGGGVGSQTAAAFLDVQYKAKVVSAPKERHLPYGKPASLDCHFSANPPLTNLRWEKDGFLFDPYNVPGVFYSRNGSLLFNQVDESHEGEYSCTPYNALGSAGPSPGVRVRVQRPPALLTRPRPLYVARLGDSLALPCAPAAPAAVHWARKDGSELPGGRSVQSDGNLTIVEVAEEDRGVYVCTVSNEAASLAAETELLVENVPPRAPHHLTVSAAPDSLHLTWEPGHAGLEVDYDVWYRERTASEWRTMRILSRGVTEATLVGLRPGTEYELRVLSQDLIGDGLFSKPAFARTLGFAEDEVTEERLALSAAAATTEPAAAGGAGEGERLEVWVRRVEEGALVRWRGARAGAACELRWAEGAPPHTAAPLSTHTRHDYALVGAVTEGAQYWAQVTCGRAAGGAALGAAGGRLGGAALGAGGAALLLAALGGALYAARRYLRAPGVRCDKRAR